MGKPRIVVGPPIILVALIAPPDDTPPMHVRIADPHPYFLTWPGQGAMTNMLTRHVPAGHRVTIGYDPAGGLQ